MAPPIALISTEDPGAIVPVQEPLMASPGTVPGSVSGPTESLQPTPAKAKTAAMR